MTDGRFGKPSRILDPEGMKTCSGCKQLLPHSKFRKGGGRAGLQNNCRDCANAGLRKRKRELPPETITAMRRRDWLKKYGITEQRFQELWAKQCGACAICETPLQEKRVGAGKKTPDTVHIDHDHETGAVRGLLCHRCNVAIGLLGHNFDRVWRAGVYLASQTDLIDLSSGPTALTHLAGEKQ